MAILYYSGQREETGCSLASGQSPGRLAPAGDSGGARGAFADRGRPAVWGGARHGDPLDGDVATARGEGVSGPSSRTTAASARSSSDPAASPRVRAAETAAAPASSPPAVISPRSPRCAGRACPPLSFRASVATRDLHLALSS